MLAPLRPNNSNPSSPYRSNQCDGQRDNAMMRSRPWPLQRGHCTSRKAPRIETSGLSKTFPLISKGAERVPHCGTPCASQSMISSGVCALSNGNAAQCLPMAIANTGLHVTGGSGDDTLILRSLMNSNNYTKGFRIVNRPTACSCFMSSV